MSVAPDNTALHDARMQAQPIKILHVETGRHLHGGARQVLYLMQGLAERGFDNVLVCTQGSAMASEAADIARVVALPWHGEADALAALRLLRVVREERPAILHAHSRRGADWFTALAAATSQVPAVVSRRVDNVETGRLVQWKYRQYRAAIAISAAIAEVLRDTLGDALPPVRLIHSAVDSARFAPGGDRAWLAAEFELDPAQPIIGMVAQFIPRKGHTLLLDALPAVWQRHPGVQCLLFGRGPERTRIAARVQASGAAPRVRLPGFRSDMARILPALDMVVHPALTEGLGVALLEAGACGVPVVAAASGGIPEVIEDGRTGLLIPAGASQPLAAAMLRLLDNPEFALKLGDAARLRVERDFSVAAMTTAHATLYEEMATTGALR